MVPKTLDIHCKATRKWTQQLPALLGQDMLGVVVSICTKLNA